MTKKKAGRAPAAGKLTPATAGVRDVEVQALAASQAGLVAAAAAHRQIASTEEYAAAGAFLTGFVKPYLAEVDRVLGEPKTAAWALYKMLQARFQEFRGPGEQAELAVKEALADYDERAEVERRRVLEAERARQEAEEREALERERRLLAEAEAAQEAGDADRAEELLEEASAEPEPDSFLPPPRPVVVPEPPRAAGVSIRREWDWELLDATKLRQPFLVPDEGKIGKLVRALGEDAIETVGPGAIRVFQRRVVSGRRGPGGAG